MKAYEKLLEPITIGTHQWRNRMVKAPSSAMSWDPGQFCNERIIGLYDAISKGGASAIILGGMICDDPATLIDDADGGVYTVETYPLGGLYDDKFIPGLSQLADAVHGNGCELIAQIFQNGAAIKTKGGAWCSSTLTADELPSPEPYCNPTRGLSLEEIEAFKERYFAAAERGHEVTLCEKESVLALELNLATMVKGTVCENVPALIDWLTSQAKKTPGLTIKTNTTVTPDFVRAMKPDAVIVATGGVYGAPDVPGIDLGIVSTVPQLTR